MLPVLAVSDVHPVAGLRAEPSISPTAATRRSRRQVRGALPRRRRPSRPAGPCITRYISIAGAPAPASIRCALATILDCCAYQKILVSRTTGSDHAASMSRSNPERLRGRMSWRYCALPGRDARPRRFRLQTRRSRRPRPGEETRKGERTRQAISGPRTCFSARRGGVGDRGFALLTQPWQILQHVTAGPREIGQIARAALVPV
jgi:hypothetical protein